MDTASVIKMVELTDQTGEPLVPYCTPKMIPKLLLKNWKMDLWLSVSQLAELSCNTEVVS